MTPRERLGLDFEHYWWLDLLRVGDPLWFNYPDSLMEDELDPMYRLLGWLDDSAEERVGQPALLDLSPPWRAGVPAPDAEARRVVTHPMFLLPVPFPYARRALEPTRGALVALWREAGARGGTLGQALEAGRL